MCLIGSFAMLCYREGQKSKRGNRDDSIEERRGGAVREVFDTKGRHAKHDGQMKG